MKAIVFLNRQWHQVTRVDTLAHFALVMQMPSFGNLPKLLLIVGTMRHASRLASISTVVATTLPNPAWRLVTPTLFHVFDRESPVVTRDVADRVVDQFALRRIALLGNRRWLSASTHAQAGRIWRRDAEPILAYSMTGKARPTAGRRVASGGVAAVTTRSRDAARSDVTILATESVSDTGTVSLRKRLAAVFACADQVSQSVSARATAHLTLLRLRWLGNEERSAADTAGTLVGHGDLQSLRRGPGQLQLSPVLSVCGV